MVELPIRALCLLPIAALLTACGSPKPAPDPRIEVLEQRLAEQTRRIDSLEAARQRAAMNSARIMPAAQPAPTEFLLIGAGSLANDSKRYLTEGDCEAAKKTVVDNALAWRRKRADVVARSYRRPLCRACQRCPMTRPRSCPLCSRPQNKSARFSQTNVAKLRHTRRPELSHLTTQLGTAAHAQLPTLAA